MNKEEVYTKLCYYDNRNPLFRVLKDDTDKKDGVCYCDNCFTGRNELAVELLECMNILDSLDV